jgi:hypothetical protein
MTTDSVGRFFGRPTIFRQGFSGAVGDNAGHNAGRAATARDKRESASRRLSTPCTAKTRAKSERIP